MSNGQQYTTMDNSAQQWTAMDNNGQQWTIIPCFEWLFFLSLLTSRLPLWILKYLPFTHNTFQMFIKCVYFKSFTNSLQIFFKCLTNFSFFVNNRDKLIHSLAAFPPINISIAINHYFSGASAATQKVSISKSSRYLVIRNMQNILWQIPADLVRSFQIFAYSNISWKILADLDKSNQILTDLSRSCQIFPDLHILQ